MLAVAAPLVSAHVDLATAVRFSIALAVTTIIIYIITGVIDDLQRELINHAATDPLTGALNRRQMEPSLAEAVERRSRSGAPASVLLMDIDHFKSINDRFGHDVGDVVLKNLVALVAKGGRRLDRTFRIGGEEFLILLPDTRAADAIIHAERLRHLIETTSLTEKSTVTVSIGVAECVPNQPLEAWVKQADDALYLAKQKGRNRVVCETPPQDTPTALEIAGADRRAQEH
jgi:diguanylate cyclase (GGDEF)-like protein